MTDLPVFYTTEEVAAAFRRTAEWAADKAKAGLAGEVLRTSGAENGQLRWSPENVEQLKAALTPAPTPARKRRRRRT
jgi:hypothetical protein